MAITHIVTRQGNSTFSNGPTPTSHDVPKPSEAVEGTYVIVELALAIPGTSVTGAITAVPAGWTELTSGWKGGTPSVRYAAYGKFMAASEAASWTWGFEVASNVISHYRVFSGVDMVSPVPEAGWLVQASGGTSRVTPTITTSGERFIIYATHDRNASTPIAPEPDTALTSSQPSSVQLTTARIGIVPAGSYSRTFTGAASTSVAGSSIIALQAGPDTPPPPSSTAITHIVTRAGNSTAYDGPTPTSHEIIKPAEVMAGRYFIVELALAISGSNLAGNITTVPAGWTLLTGGWKGSSTTSIRYASYGKFMQAAEPASWTWGYDAPSSVVSQYRVFSGVDTTNPVPESGWLAQASSSSSRTTPTITTAGDRFIVYSTHDRSGSSPTAPEPDTALNTFRSSSAELMTARIGYVAAGTYSRTFTNAVSSSTAGASIMALQAAPSAPGLLVGVWDGATEVKAYMTIWDGATEVKPQSFEIGA